MLNVIQGGLSLADKTAPGAEIKCGGNPLPEQTASKISEVMVESRLDLPGSFALSLTDASLTFIDSKEGTLNEGVKLEIALGYSPQYQSLITGEISAVYAEMSAQGVYSRVTGFDMLHRLARGTNYHRFETGSGEALTDGDIAKSILNNAGLTPTVDQTPERSIPRVQDNRSDLDFLVMLAGLNSFYLYSDGDKGFFSGSPPDRGEVELEWGQNLRAFYPRLNLCSLVNTLEIRGWDRSQDESFAETEDRPRNDLLFLSSAGRDMMDRGSGGRSSLNLHDSLIADANDAKRFLPGAMRNKQYFVSASGSCSGDASLRAGTKLKVRNAGRFSGDYFVTRAVHRFNSRGYTTDFDARMTL